MVGLEHYLIVSAALLSLGVLGLLTRRNAVNVLMSIELILNSANINLVAFSRFGGGGVDAQVFAIYVIVLAAATCLWAALYGGALLAVPVKF